MNENHPLRLLNIAENGSCLENLDEFPMKNGKFSIAIEAEQHWGTVRGEKCLGWSRPFWAGDAWIDGG